MLNQCFEFQGYKSHCKSANEIVVGAPSLYEFESIVKQNLNNVKDKRLSQIKIELMYFDEICEYITHTVSEFFLENGNTVSFLDKLLLSKKNAKGEVETLCSTFLNNVEYFDIDFAPQDLILFIQNVVRQYIDGKYLYVIKTNYDIIDYIQGRQQCVLKKDRLILKKNQDGDKEEWHYKNDVYNSTLYADSSIERPVLYFYKTVELAKLQEKIEDKNKENTLGKLLQNENQTLDFSIKILPINVMALIKIVDEFNKRFFAENQSILDSDFLLMLLPYIEYARPKTDVENACEVLPPSSTMTKDDLLRHKNAIDTLEYRKVESVGVLESLFNGSLMDAYKMVYNIIMSSYTLPNTKKKSA